jgi:hypothetical protein
MARRLWVASRKGLFRFEPTPEGWRSGPPAFLAEPVTAVLEDARDGCVYAALRLGHFGCKLHRSEDGGETWAELAAPAYPAAGDGEGPALDMIWTLESGGPDEPGVIWAGTSPGGLFVSRDRGASWALVESLWERPERAKWFGGGYDHPGVHSVLVDPRDGRRIAVGVSCGGVWRSDDGGASWRQAGRGLRAAYLPPDQAYDPTSQDPHRLAACAAAPDRVWCQHHNGVFRSDDGGETFTEVGVDAFGFAVAAHPGEPDVAWFAPAVKDECRVPKDARLVATRTRDGGAAFEPLAAGLDDGPRYDLVYRHALTVDASGRRLAMGSTTGGLWTSDDAGAFWTRVPAGLPPINAVAFAG